MQHRVSNLANEDVDLVGNMEPFLWEPNCWKMCASTTMVSLKFPLQDPLQAVATVATTTLPHNFYITDLLLQQDRSLQHYIEIIQREAVDELVVKEDRSGCARIGRRRSNRLRAEELKKGSAACRLIGCVPKKKKKKASNVLTNKKKRRRSVRSIRL